MGLTPDWAGRTALVTGPRGFVGAHLCNALLDAGVRVVGLEAAGPGEGYFDVQGLADRIDLVRGSILDPDALSRAFSRQPVHFVFHIAGQAIVGKAIQEPLQTLEVNVRGTCLVLEHCRRLWDEGRGELRGVVLAGTERVYGRQTTLPYTEDLPLLATSPYDASKIAAEVISRSYAQTYGLPAAVARCANIYGPGDANLTRIVPDTVINLLRGDRPQIRSDGTPERDYLCVGDLAGAYMKLALCATQDAVRGEAFNIGSGRPVSVLELVRLICAACDRPELEPEVLGRPTGELDRQYVAIGKAQERLGWSPQTDLPSGLRETAAWYRDWLLRPPAPQRPPQAGPGAAATSHPGPTQGSEGTP